MKYFKDEYNQIFAYSMTDIEQVHRLTELELILDEKESIFIDAQNNVQKTKIILNELTESLNDELSEDEFNQLKLKIEAATADNSDAVIAFNEIESEYQPFQNELKSILPVFFDIREKLKTMAEMTSDEVDEHINPPATKEQLVSIAEQQKIVLLNEATNVIAPLQDAIEFDDATDEEIAQCKTWKKYRISLNRVDTSTAPDIEWPVKP